MEFIDDSGFLTDKQFGYRQGLGTGATLFEFLNDTCKNRACSHLTSACFLDLKKAYDSVIHISLRSWVSLVYIKLCRV